MIIFNLKSNWFNLIKLGKKISEYREYKPYWKRYDEFSQRLGKNFVNTTTIEYKKEDTQMLYDMCESIIHNYNKLYK